MKFKVVVIISLLLFATSSSSAQQKNTTTVKAIIEKYFDAIGGKERARQIHSFSSEAKGTLHEKDLILIQKMMLPNSFSNAMSIGEKIISKTIFDGEQGLTIQQGEEIEFTKDEEKRYKKQRSIFPEFNYIKSAKYVGIEKVERQDCYVIQFENNKIYYSKDTGLKRKGVSIQEKNGKTFLQQLFFGNYVAIEGLLFPTNLLMVAGNNKIEFQTRSILINRDVSKKDFEIKY